MRNDLRQITRTTFQFWIRANSFKVFELRQALLAIVLIALTRTIMDRLFWSVRADFRLHIMAFMLWTFYIASLCISTGFLLSRLKAGIDFKQAFTAAICLYWVIPLVPLFSLLPWEKNWGLGIYTTIPFFARIPTFAVEKNYLPLGMIIVTPFLIWKTFQFLIQAGRISRLKSFLGTLFIFLLIYICYYQWIWNISVMTLFNKGLLGYTAIAAQFVTYSFLCQLIAFMLTPTLVGAFEGRHMILYTAGSGILLALLLFIPKVGFMAVHLIPDHP
jgi:hypothetical protein